MSKPPARVRALWSLGLVVARSCALSAVSVLLAQWLDRPANTVRQQWRDWGYDAPATRGADRQEGVVETCFAPVLAWGLSWWDGHQLARAVEATPLGPRFVGLALRVLYRGCAIPVAGTPSCPRASNTPGAARGCAGCAKGARPYRGASS